MGSIVPSARVDYLVLVNREHPVPDGWEKNLETVHVTNSLGEDVEVEKKAYEAFQRLRLDLEENDGIRLELDSGLRSISAQQDIMDRFMVKYGAEYTLNTVAPPGFSEHHTGLAMDLYFRVLGQDGNDTDVCENEAMIEYSEIWKNIHAKLAAYGFILRYPEGCESITGYGYEPWHIRYLDNPEIAKEIMDRGITLEEYFADPLPNRVLPSQSPDTKGEGTI